MQICTKRTISRALIGALVALLLFPAPVCSEDLPLERLVRKDGTSVVGVVVGYGKGAYRVRVGEGIVEVPARDVRTIEPAGRTAPREVIDNEPPASWVTRVAEALGSRPVPDVTPESRRLFGDAMAALLRGDWDFALQAAASVAEREPSWVDPLLCLLVVQTETGRESDALRVALRVTSEFPEDPLSERVSAEVFRRGGFPFRAAELDERWLLSTAGPEARRELTRIWWPLDIDRAKSHWDLFLASDPQLERSEFPEAAMIRKTRSAIALGDLSVAGQLIEEAARGFPWAQREIRAERVALARARLRQAELAGDLPLATLAAEALAALEPEDVDLGGRLTRLREQGIERALRVDDPVDLERWFREHAHLLAGETGSERSVAARLQELGLDVLSRGQFTDARAALSLANEIDAEAESTRAARQVIALVEMAVGELSQRREERATSVLRILHEFMPQRDAIAVERLVRFLESPETSFITPVERRALARKLAVMYGESGVSLGSISAPVETPESAGADSAIAVTTPENEAGLPDEVTRWFPLDIGTRWTYRLGDGTIEQREVLSVVPSDPGSWMVLLRVTPQGRIAYQTRVWVEDGDVVLGSSTAPPGEVLLRGGLRPGDRWEWRRGNFAYVRSVERPEGPIETSIGRFDEARVVTAENSLHSEEGGRTWSAQHRITFVAGVGVVRIEGASDTVDRELIEFQPGASVTQTSFAEPRAVQQD